jgi:hypothetical protein
MNLKPKLRLFERVSRMRFGKGIDKDRAIRDAKGLVRKAKELERLIYEVDLGYDHLTERLSMAGLSSDEIALLHC